MNTAQVLAFATLLRRHRIAAGLTQEELAERTGLSREAISLLERGERRTPYPHTIRALAQALGLSAHDKTALDAGLVSCMSRRKARVRPQPS